MNQAKQPRPMTARMLTALFIVLAAVSAPQTFFSSTPVTQAQSLLQAKSSSDDKTASPSSPLGATGCPAPAWTVVRSPNVGEGYNVLNDVSATSITEMWAVGYYTDTTNLRHTLIMDGDFDSWSVVPSPSRAEDTILEAVSATSNGDAWAVGSSYNAEAGTYRPLLLHFGGAGWYEVTDVPLPASYHSADLKAVVALPTGEMWAIGNITLGGSQGPAEPSPLVVHWDGSQWDVSTGNIGNYWPWAYSLDARATSANDVWVVGSHPATNWSVVLHWNGQEWTQTETSGARAYGIDAISPTSVWIAGSNFSRSPMGAYHAMSEHWDGATWSGVAAEELDDWATFLDVEALAYDDVWAVGNYLQGTPNWRPGGGPYPQVAMVQHWDGAHWNYIQTPGETANSFLMGIVAVEKGQIWAVGSANHKTLIMHYAPTFSDVAPDVPFYDYIEGLACEAVIGGFEDRTFRPNNPITRAQIAKLVSNAAGYSDRITERVFTDVTGGVHYEYVQRIAMRSIVSGYECGGPGEPCDLYSRPYFRPNNNMSRGQMAKVVSNAKRYNDEIPAGRQTFNDVPPEHTFWLYIERVAQHNVVSGYECGAAGEPCPGAYFRPQSQVTRGQAAKIVYNAFYQDPEGRPCADIPDPFSMFIAPYNCALAGTKFEFTGMDFLPNESVGMYITAPDGSVLAASFKLQADEAGTVRGAYLQTNDSFPRGLYKVTMESMEGNREAWGYFKLLDP